MYIVLFNCICHRYKYNAYTYFSSLFVVLQLEITSKVTKVTRLLSGVFFVRYLLTLCLSNALVRTEYTAFLTEQPPGQ